MGGRREEEGGVEWKGERGENKGGGGEERLDGERPEILQVLLSA